MENIKRKVVELTRVTTTIKNEYELQVSTYSREMIRNKNNSTNKLTGWEMPTERGRHDKVLH